MSRHETTRDLEMDLWGTRAIVPAGTRVHLVRNASGTQGDLYAVSSIELLVRLSRNNHDPVYRFAFVPADAVGEAADAGPAVPAL